MRRIKEMLGNVHPRAITKWHVLQSLLMGAYIFVAFLAMGFLKSDLAAASLGASAFIAFSFPHTDSSRPRFLLGGYAVGAVCGIACGWLNAAIGAALPVPGHALFCALAALLSMIAMTVLNYEHPPAAALAVAITIDPSPALLGLAAVGCVAVLCIVKETLKPHLRNL